MRTFYIVAGAFLMAACATTRPAALHFNGSANPNSPLSSSVQAGDLIFLAGMLGTDSTGRLAPGGIGPETRQTLANIKRELAKFGIGMERVVYCNVFLADYADWGAMNTEYVKAFPTTKPARTAVGNHTMSRNGRVEIQCIATR